MSHSTALDLSGCLEVSRVFSSCHPPSTDTITVLVHVFFPATTHPLPGALNAITSRCSKSKALSPVSIELCPTQTIPSQPTAASEDYYINLISEAHPSLFIDPAQSSSTFATRPPAPRSCASQPSHPSCDFPTSTESPTSPLARLPDCLWDIVEQSAQYKHSS